MAIDTIKSTAVLDGAIATADIADANITTAKIADDAVTEDKLANAINTSIAAKSPTASPTFSGNVGIDVTDKADARLVIRSTGVDGTYQPIVSFQYSGNSNEHNSIGSAVSSNAALSGINFKISNGGGVTTQTEVARITRNGITFNGDSAAENALNDYEEGRFDILFADANSCSETLSMRYTKVGQVVHVEGPNRGSAGSSNGQYASLSGTSNSHIDITSSLPYVPIESGCAISPIHRNIELRTDGSAPNASASWLPMLAWQAGSATLVLADTRGGSANEHAYWGGANGQTLRKADTRTNVVFGFNFSYRTAS